MMLFPAALLLIAGFALLPYDRRTANWFREQLHKPLFQLALKITDWAKGGPWIIGAALFYLLTQTWIWQYGVSPWSRWISDLALALLASFVAGSVVLHIFKIFLGRRRPRDEFEHGLYGFRYFTWQLQHDSFPSGHAMTIFAVATLLSAAVPVLTPIWLALAFCLAMARALLTAHFLSDVMVGGFIGILAARETLVLGFPALAPGWF